MSKYPGSIFQHRWANTTPRLEKALLTEIVATVGGASHGNGMTHDAWTAIGLKLGGMTVDACR
jgi:hypothetical protein